MSCGPRGRIYLSTIAGSAAGTAGTAKVRLFDVVVGTGAASAVVTIYEGSSASGTVVAVIDASASRDHHFGGLPLNGLYVDQTGGAAKVTVTYD